MISSVLVVCTGNVCRSAMAEALLARRVGASPSGVRVASAGTAALVGYPPPPVVVELMAEIGFDVGGHRARQVTDELALRHELILTMEEAQRRWMEARWPLLRGRVHLFGLTGDVPDPYGRPREVFVECLSQLEAGVETWAKRLLP